MKSTYLIVLVIIVLLGCKEDDIPKIKFVSFPMEETDHNREFLYFPRAEDSNGSSITYRFEGPAWLQLDVLTNKLSGTPGWNNLDKNYQVTVYASNGNQEDQLDFELKIKLGEIVCSQHFGDPATSPYRLPYTAGSSYLLSQSNCPTNSSWGHHNWFAYDFELPMNTPVLAIAGGRVIATKELNPDGTRECNAGKENYIFVEHGDRTVANYVHLIQNGVEVEVGDLVERGQLLGYSGDSGCSAGPHLHLALFRERGNYNRQYTAPLQFQ